MFYHSNHSFFVLVFSSLPFYIEELYQQQLAKALAHYFQAKLLLLDVTNFSLKVSLGSFIEYVSMFVCVCVRFIFY